jgi:hypothetical protein
MESLRRYMGLLPSQREQERLWKTYASNWDAADLDMARVLARAGVPARMRRVVWPAMADAGQLERKNPGSYALLACGECAPEVLSASCVCRKSKGHFVCFVAVLLSVPMGGSGGWMTFQLIPNVDVCSFFWDFDGTKALNEMTQAACNALWISCCLCVSVSHIWGEGVHMRIVLALVSIERLMLKKKKF